MPFTVHQFHNRQMVQGRLKRWRVRLHNGSGLYHLQLKWFDEGQALARSRIAIFYTFLEALPLGLKGAPVPD